MHMYIGYKALVGQQYINEQAGLCRSIQDKHIYQAVVNFP